MGRKTTGAAIAQTLGGSALAKKRMEMIIATLSGELSVGEACEVLSINEAMFYKLRNRYLEESVALLEPRKTGRKRADPTTEEATIALQQKEISQLKLALEAQRIQTEIALVAPHLLQASSKKKKGRSGRKNAGKKKLRQ